MRRAFSKVPARGGIAGSLGSLGFSLLGHAGCWVVLVCTGLHWLYWVLLFFSR